jgi:hypothetical protein
MEYAGTARFSARPRDDSARVIAAVALTIVAFNVVAGVPAPPATAANGAGVEWRISDGLTTSSAAWEYEPDVGSM